MSSFNFDTTMNTLDKEDRKALDNFRSNPPAFLTVSAKRKRP